MVEAYNERLIAEGRLSNCVIVRHLTVLHGIFKRAGRVWGLARNPASADLVERPRVVYTGEFDTLDRDEIELLAGAAADAQDAALYKMAAFAGLRQGELLALRWRDVDFVGGLVHVRRNYTDRREKVPKGRKVRSVPMTPDVVDALARLKEREHFTADDDLIFCTRLGGHLDAWALRRRFYRALKKAGLRRIRFHDLRHHFGSAAITVLDGYAVQSYMGHALDDAALPAPPAAARGCAEAARGVRRNAGGSSVNPGLACGAALCIAFAAGMAAERNPRPPRPPEVERRLRREAGYGCCKCGLPIYDYHHIFPYHEDDPYPPDEMMILCPLHHRQTLGGALPEKEQWELKRRPCNIGRGLVDGDLVVNQAYCAVAVGQSLLVGEAAFVVVDGEELFSLRLDPDGSRLLISLTAYDDRDNVVAIIEDNEWISGDPFPWDIESHFQYLRMRRQLGEISLEVDARKEPVRVRADLCRNGHRVRLSPREIRVDGEGLGGLSIRNLGLVADGLEIDTVERLLGLRPDPKYGQGVIVGGQESFAELLVESVRAWNELRGGGHAIWR
jgi:site-specific recombinase XerD